jgi:hypothetical protein
MDLALDDHRVDQPPATKLVRVNPVDRETQQKTGNSSRRLLSGGIGDGFPARTITPPLSEKYPGGRRFCGFNKILMNQCRAAFKWQRRV